MRLKARREYNAPHGRSRLPFGVHAFDAALPDEKVGNFRSLNASLNEEGNDCVISPFEKA
jgi:hypothetical protein